MKNLLLSVCMLVAGAAFAGNVTWTGAANDGNKWSTPGNWKDATDAPTLPTTADVAVFNVAEPTTVNVDTEDAIANQIKIEAASAAVTFGGTGKISISCSGDARIPALTTKVAICNLNCNTEWTTFDCAVSLSSSGKINVPPAVVFNGDVTAPTCPWMGFVSIDGHAPAVDKSRVVIHGNFTMLTTSGHNVYCLDPLAELYVDIAEPEKSFTCYAFYFTVNNGAAATCGKVSFVNGRATVVNGFANATTKAVSDCLVIDGGTVVAGEASENMTNGFRFVSGTYSTTKIVSSAWKYPSRLILSGFEDGYFGAGKTMIYNSGYANCVYFYDEAEPQIGIDGTIVATNSNSSIRFCNPQSSKGTLSGSGEIVARVLNVAGKYATATFKGLTLTVGDGFQPGNNYSTTVFDGATLQSYGNWGHLGSNAGTYKLVGAVDFNTADAFGGMTPHSVWLKTVSVGDALD